MNKLFFTLVYLALFTILLVLNFANKSAVNIFGFIYRDVPVVVIALSSFLLGVLYAFVLCAVSHFRKRRKIKEQEEPQARPESPRQEPPAVPPSN